MNNLFMASLPTFAFLIAVSCGIVCIIAMVYGCYCDAKTFNPKKGFIVCAVILIVAIVVSALICPVVTEYNLNHELSSIDAQLEALETTWGFGKE